ncbi:MAG: ATP-binding protein [Candidatus Zixiibacteriota bacterium]
MRSQKRKPEISEAKLRQISKKLKSFEKIFDNIPFAIEYVDRNFHHIYKNKMHDRYSRFLRNVLNSSDEPSSISAKKALSKINNSIEKVFSTGKKETIELSIKNGDRYRYFRSEINPEFEADGSIDKVFSVIEDITDTQHYINQLATDKKKWDSFFHNLPHILITVDLDFKITYYNRKPSKLSETRILGSSLIDWIPEDRKQFVKNKIYESINTGHNVIFDAQGSLFLGEFAYFKINVIPLILDSQIQEVAMVFVNTTEIENFKKEVDKRASYFETVFNSIQEAVAMHKAIFDKDGQIVDFQMLDLNKAAKNLLGLRYKNLLKMPVSQIFPENYTEDLPKIEHTIKTGEPTMIERYYKVFGKTLLTFIYSLGENEFVSTTIDITNRKNIENDLRDKQSKLHAQYQSIPIPTYTWQKKDGDIFLIAYNKAAEKMTGGVIQNFIGATVNEVHHNRPDILYDIMKCFETRSTINRELRYNLANDSNPRDLRVKYAFVEPDLLLVHTEDITEQKKAEQEKKKMEERLRHAKKLETIGTLAGGIAHDFNNIITPLIGYTEISMETAEGNKVLTEQLEHVFKAGVRAKNLVDQILTFSRQVEQKRTPINISNILDEAVKLFEYNLDETVEISTQIDTEDCSVMADPTQIHQVILNLCKNAYQALNGKGGKITVMLRNKIVDELFSRKYPNLHKGNYVLISIADTGIGMDKITRERIFEPFFTTKSDGEGTGLGLSVTHGIIISHGGEIIIDSKPGEGTVFDVYLPCAVDKENQPKFSSGAIKSEHVLIIDKEIVIPKLIKKYLEPKGYQITTLNSVKMALSLIDKKNFDLVMIDSDMSGAANCQDFAKKMLQTKPELPIIIMLNRNTQDSNEEKRIFSGANIAGFISKPIENNKLEEAVLKAIKANGANNA